MSSDRQRAHDRLRDEQPPHALEAMQAALDGMALLDGEGRFTFVNQAHADVYGYADPEEMVGEHWSILYEPDEVTRFEEEILPKLQDGGSWRGAAEGLRADGRTFPQELSLSTTPDGGLVCIVRDVTERRRVERNLERHKEELELAEDVAGLGHWVWWPHEGRAEWSNGHYELLGVDPAKVRPGYDAYREHVHPEDRDRVEGLVRAAVLEREPFRAEHRLLRADGTERQVLLVGRVREDGGELRLFGTVLDVTELREEAKQRSRLQERIELLLEHHPIAIFELEGDPLAGPVPRLEITGRDLLGLPAEDIRDDPSAFFDRIHPEDVGRVREGTRRVLEEAEPTQFVYRYQPPDHDGWIWLENQLVPRIDAEGETEGFAGVFRDVSDREAQHAALVRSQGNLELAEEVAGLGHWRWDIGSGELEWSDGCYAIHGRDPETFDPTFDGFLETIHPEDRDDVRARIQRCLERLEPWSLDYRVPLDDGVRVLHAQGQLETDEDGVPIHAFGTAQDVTQRRKEQDRLEAYAEELERFAYVAAHDLTEPLRNIAGHLQLLERGYADGLDEQARELIAYAVDGAKRLRQLINDMLAYTRASQQGLSQEEVDLERCLETAVENLAVRLEEEQASVTNGSLPRVVADDHQITHVLQNLIANAITFNESAQPQVHVDADRAGSRVVVSVQDDGIGIPERHQDQIFHVFERLHNQTEYPGTGLGLAICRRIVERHGGQIWVHSEEGRGATFCFTLSAALEA